MLNQATINLVNTADFGALLFVGALKDKSDVVTTIVPEPAGIKRINFIFGVEGDEMVVVTMLAEVIKQNEYVRRVVSTALNSVNSGKVV